MSVHHLTHLSWAIGQLGEKKEGIVFKEGPIAYLKGSITTLSI